MKKVLLTPVLLSVLMFPGCRQTGELDEPGDPVPVSGENFNFYTSSAMFREASDKRSGTYSRPFDVTGVWRAGAGDEEYMNIEIRHKMDCPGKFDVIWDGRIAESYPPQTWIFIKLDPEECKNLDDFRRDTISLDLQDFMGDQFFPHEGVVHVLNASSDQEVSSDEPVSDQ